MTDLSKDLCELTPQQQLKLIKVYATYGNICITKRIYNDNWCITNHFKNGIGESTDFSEALAIFVTNTVDKVNPKEIERVLNND